MKSHYSNRCYAGAASLFYLNSKPYTSNCAVLDLMPLHYANYYKNFAIF